MPASADGVEATADVAVETGMKTSSEVMGMNVGTVEMGMKAWEEDASV